MGCGTDGEQYAMLWSYTEEIRNSNPGTTVKIKSKLIGGLPQFKRLYICWGALKQEFLKGCRPIICLDGCHLKISVGGILLSAVGIDANNYKQKGLIDAIDQLLPGCEHRFCVMHLYKNFKNTHKGMALKDILWRAARATRMADFEKAMNDMRRNVAAYEWLMQKPAAHWSKSHFSTHSKSDILLNNISESFNHMVLRARSKHIVDMLETIRLILMKRIHMRRDQMLKHNGDLCPKIAKILEDMKKKSMEFIAHWNGKDEFEIESAYGTRFRLHLGDKTCSCRSQLMGTLNDMDMWPKVDFPPLIPSIYENLPGRPKKYARKKDHDEVKDKGKHVEKTGKLGKKGVTIKCSLCHQPNHNGRKRKTPTAEKEPNVISPTRVTRSTSRSNIVISPTRVTRSSTMTSRTRVTRVNAMKKSEKPKKDQGKITQKGKAKIIENPRKKLEVRKNPLVQSKGKSVVTEPTQATTKEGIDAMILTQSSINNSLLRPLWRPTGSSTSNSARFSMFKGTQIFDKVATTSEEEEAPVCRQQ
ncbi:UNVERIFIED_CONTAM: hypothetical protein Slati_4096300 [Sesamum latifolium]|uniref:Protein FAR1-RELATED SEQUENCE n=1 Tax=Sesamum latifolium TaxID=2727402 RepID=A0AAW2T7G3_9LAMI